MDRFSICHGYGTGVGFLCFCTTYLVHYKHVLYQLCINSIFLDSISRLALTWFRCCSAYLSNPLKCISPHWLAFGPTHTPVFLCIPNAEYWTISKVASSDHYTTQLLPDEDELLSFESSYKAVTSSYDSILKVSKPGLVVSVLGNVHISHSSYIHKIRITIYACRVYVHAYRSHHRITFNPVHVQPQASLPEMTQFHEYAAHPRTAPMLAM